ncbi:MAG: aminopeptidase P N-terminal domain-containing protein, partial [Myxococcota bacterium]
MNSTSPFVLRRERLRQLLPHGLVVLGGHPQLPMNLPMNLSPARQSSHILFLTGLQEVECAMLLRLDSGRLELFLPEKEEGDDIWHGPTPSYQETAVAHGADAAYALSGLEARIQHHQATGGGPLYSLANADPAWRARMQALGLELGAFGRHNRYEPNPLADAMIAIRLCQDEVALQEMRKAASLAAEVHRLAMRATAPGGSEAQLRALMEGCFMSAGVRPSYTPIVTVRGEILHCRANPYTLQADQLLLADVGCETPAGYASDITRVWPVRGSFDSRQRDIYEVVLEANQCCIEKLAAGREYKEIHLLACLKIAEGLRDLGLLRGHPEELVERDAHALFFPHGVGHLLGLDVHDLEDLGDRAGYGPDRVRSTRFGLAWLRLNRKLETGMVVTIEPGIYFIPGLLNDARRVELYNDCVNFDKARQYLGMGGIRIEDDVLVTANGSEVLTSDAPKSVAAVEAEVGAEL